MTAWHSLSSNTHFIAHNTAADPVEDVENVLKRTSSPYIGSLSSDTSASTSPCRSLKMPSDKFFRFSTHRLGIIIRRRIILSIVLAVMKRDACAKIWNLPWSTPNAPSLFFQTASWIFFNNYSFCVTGCRIVCIKLALISRYCWQTRKLCWGEPRSLFILTKVGIPRTLFWRLMGRTPKPCCPWDSWGIQRRYALSAAFVPQTFLELLSISSLCPLSAHASHLYSSSIFIYNFLCCLVDRVFSEDSSPSVFKWDHLE